MEHGRSVLAPKKWLLVCWLVILFGLGLAIRLYDLADLPLDFHSTRQMRSAIIARGMFYQWDESTSSTQRDTAIQMWQSEGLIEPPIMETLSALTYRAIGQEVLWIPRLFSTLFWIIGGVFLLLLACELAGADGGLVAAAFYLFLPYGALASRSFQPDPLMTAMLIAALWAMVRWLRKPTWNWVLCAGLLGGLAILVKAIAVFFIAGAWVGLIFASMGIKTGLRNRQVWVLAALTIAPYILFHIYGMYISGELASQFSRRFFPQLWIDPIFYARWKDMIASTTGFVWFIVAILSTFLVKSPPLRGMISGVWLGYLIYGFTLPYHISTHDYYQLPLIPLVAFGLAVTAGLVFNYAKAPGWLFTPLISGAILLTVLTQAWDIRVALKRNDYRSEAGYWQTLGEKLGHTSQVIGLTHDYGYRLVYWGWVKSTPWMTSGDFNLQTLEGGQTDIESYFNEVTAGKDYFVVTLSGELDSQPKLKSLLDKHYPLVEDSPDTKIYDLKHPYSP